MGNNCFGFKKWLIEWLRPLSTLLVIPALMPQSESKDYCVVAVGAAGMGKSMPMRRWMRGNFCDAYLPTIADTSCQGLSSKYRAAALRRANFTSNHRFLRLQRLTIARGPPFILVYSITEKQTLDELKPCYKLICKVKDNTSHKYPIMLVDYKCKKAAGSRR